MKEVNRGDMREINVPRQFLEASSPRSHFFEKTKNLFLYMVQWSVCTKFQVCLFYRLARVRDANTYTHIQLKIEYPRRAARFTWILINIG